MEKAIPIAAAISGSISAIELKACSPPCPASRILSRNSLACAWASASSAPTARIFWPRSESALAPVRCISAASFRSSDE
ncbi:hypothetical protein CWB41_14020 [Methylovirgula ligni]|nr:hypothetical protein CWB41_14020 [Methylovirgula ligni]